MAGYTRIPAGRSQPAIVRGALSVRSAASITGRSRSDSVTTASRYASSVPSSSSRRRAIGAGLCSNRSNAHASPVAVVSCPAASIVISSSRSSTSVIGSPFSSRAPSSTESTSVRSSTPEARRRRSISS